MPSAQAELSAQAPVSASLDGTDVFTELEELQAPPVPEDIHRLVVTAARPTDLAGDTSHAATFEEAVRLLDRYRNLEVIELRFNGPVKQQPLLVKASDLIIQAGEGYQPILSFEPDATDLAAGGQMIRVIGDNISWLGVHLMLTLPDEVSSGGWSLFELSQVSSLDFKDSSMTIRNAHEDGTSRHANTAFFSVSVPTSLRMMAMPGEPPPMPLTPVIDLRRCVVRGEATLIRMPEVTPLRLSWTQGLFATSERLIEAYGAANTTDRDRPIEIDLIHVTAALPKGMCRLAGTIDAQNQLRLDIECTACIFLCSSDVPLIEHTGVRDVDKAKSSWLKYRGDNFYPTLDGVPELTCWRIAPLDDSQRSILLTSDDREKPWWDGTVQPRVMWHNSPTSQAIAHRHVPADYQLVEELRNPPFQFAEEHGNAGFDFELIPAVFADPPSDSRDQVSSDQSSEASTNVPRSN